MTASAATSHGSVGRALRTAVTLAGVRFTGRQFQSSISRHIIRLFHGTLNRRFLASISTSRSAALLFTGIACALRSFQIHIIRPTTENFETYETPLPPSRLRDRLCPDHRVSVV